MSIHPQFKEILQKHGIAPRYHEPILRFIEADVLEDDELAVRLGACCNYQAACDEIKELLSLERLSNSISHFESLDTGNL